MLSSFLILFLRALHAVACAVIHSLIILRFYFEIVEHSQEGGKIIQRVPVYPSSSFPQWSVHIQYNDQNQETDVATILLTQGQALSPGRQFL